jgi:hypothetical protein
MALGLYLAGTGDGLIAWELSLRSPEILLAIFNRDDEFKDKKSTPFFLT